MLLALSAAGPVVHAPDGPPLLSVFHESFELVSTGSTMALNRRKRCSSDRDAL